ncbi:MAG: hypothetical protein KY455_13190 [Euryarchaeota archaeon]|nr:hypothetical protein [Euryarchaeota archaeon]
MAQPRQAKKDERFTEIDNLQTKYDALVQKRNELNDLARQLRSERDLLNKGNQEFRERLDKAKKERDEWNEKMREAKARRDEYQAQAKALIATKGPKSGEVSKSLPVQVRQLERQIRDLEMEQQTQPHSIEAERDLVKLIKAKQQELTDLRKQLDANREIKVALDDIDAGIDELFKRADEEHQQVQHFYELGSAAHQKFVEALEEAKTVQKEANQKHREFIATRERSDEIHAKAMEIRESMLAIRGEERAARDAARREVQDINKNVRQALNDPKRREEQAEDAIAALKKGGKISLGA